MNIDGIEIEILPDGTIKVSTDKVSAANHGNAEQFVAMLSMMAGGKASRVRKGHTALNTTTANQNKAGQ